MQVFTLNIKEPLDRKDNYASGEYTLKIKSGYVYLYIVNKQVNKIKLTDKNLDKELYKYGYKIRR